MIVSDSTALITLININEFGLLQYFDLVVIIPREVYEEVTIETKAKQFLDTEIDKGTIRVMNCTNRILFQEVSLILDSGESAAIVLAKENNLVLLIDEKKGRKFAENLGIKIIGLIGVIRFLYLREKLDKRSVLRIVAKLERSDFRVSKKILEMILK